MLGCFDFDVWLLLENNKSPLLTVIHGDHRREEGDGGQQAEDDARPSLEAVLRLGQRRGDEAVEEEAEEREEAEASGQPAPGEVGGELAAREGHQDRAGRSFSVGGERNGQRGGRKHR